MLLSSGIETLTKSCVHCYFISLSPPLMGVLGSSILFASYNVEKLVFDQLLTGIMSSLMMVVSIALVIPAIMSFTSSSSSGSGTTDKDMLTMSHGTAIILFILFLVYLRFQQKTHACLFQNVPSSDGSNGNSHDVAEDEPPASTSRRDL